MELLTTLAIATTVLSAIAFTLYKFWNKDEDTFAKAMARKQITLLDEGAPSGGGKKNNDKKEKEKKEKKKEEKKKKAAASADNKEDKPAAAAAAPVAEEPKVAAAAAAAPQVSPKDNKPAPKKTEEKKKESPKKAEKEPEVKKEVAASTTQTAPAAASAAAAAPAPVAEEAKKSNGTGAGNKKAKKPKQVEEIENEEEFVEAKTKKAKKNERKEAAPAAPAAAAEHTRPVALKELDNNKVVARFSSIDEVEVEYLEYLNNYFRDTAEKASKSVVDAARAQRQIDESSRALVAMKNEKAKVEGELESNRRAMAELASKAAHSSSAEMELRSKIAAHAQEIEKLRRDNEAAVQAAAAAAAAAVVIPPAPVVVDNSEELEKLKQEVSASSARVADLEDQLKNAKEHAAKEKRLHEQTMLQHKTREDAAVGQEVLLAESRQNAKAISQRLTELEAEKKTLEQRVSEAEKSVEEARKEGEKREASHAADTLSLKSMIEELNKEVSRFEEAKKEQAAMVEKLAAKESELKLKSEALEKAEKEINEIRKGSETTSSAAQAEIAGLKNTIAELEKALELAKSEVHILPAEQPLESEVEEVVELKKSAFLDAAPPASAAPSAEVEELKAEVERLKEKNSELRARNHAIVDHVTELEKRVMSNGEAAAAAAASTSAAAPAAAAAAPAAEEKTGGSKKNKKKGGAAAAPAAPAAAPAAEKKDEEGRVRAERRLVQSHIGKLAGVASLAEGVDQKAYESWLKSVSASIKEAQEKAKKAAAAVAAASTTAAAAAPAATAGDEEVEQLRAENESFRDALATLELELQNIEQLKSEREQTYARRIAELEKKHGKAH